MARRVDMPAQVVARPDNSSVSGKDMIHRYAGRLNCDARKVVRVAVELVTTESSPTQADVVRRLRSLGWSWTKIDKAMRDVRRAT